VPSLALTRRAALALALLLALTTRDAAAHLLPSGSDTLLGMIAAADGMLVARAASETHERGDGGGATPFLARAPVAGTVPEGGFVLDQEPPILRYASLQDALLLVARRAKEGGATRWLSVQPAGAAILLQSATLPEKSEDVLRRLWAVAHPASGEPDPGAAVAALIATLELPETKLRALAYLDLARLSSDAAHFTPADVERLSRYGERPGDDAQLAQAVRDLGTRLAAAGAPRAVATPARGTP
jgi:hypothetical protein